MKIRAGFVSNSSSSAFIYRGVVVDSNKLRKIIMKMIKAKPDVTDDDIGECEDMCLSELVEQVDIECYSNEDNDGEAIVGNYIASIDNGCIEELPNVDNSNDEKIIKKLTELGIKNTKIKTYIIGTSMG